MPYGYPETGDRVQVAELRGYRLVQERPMECRGWSPDPATGRYSGGCKCGKCDGETIVHDGTVLETIFWADNSIESRVACDDGETRLLRHKAPSGDVCF